MLIALPPLNKPKPRRFALTRRFFARPDCGYTIGCPQCDAIRRDRKKDGLHLDRCRLRIEEIIKNDPVEKVRLEAAHQRLALGQDDAPQNKKPKVTGGGECQSGDARVHGPTVQHGGSSGPASHMNMEISGNEDLGFGGANDEYGFFAREERALHEAAAMENFQNDCYSCRWAKRRKIAPAITEQPPCSVDHLPAFIQYIHGSRHESCEGFRISL